MRPFCSLQGGHGVPHWRHRLATARLWRVSQTLPLAQAQRGFSSVEPWLDRAESLKALEGRDRFVSKGMRSIQNIGVLPLEDMDGPKRMLFQEAKRLGTAGKWEEAIAIVADYGREGNEIGEAIRFTVLRACTRTFQSAQAWQAFRDLRDKHTAAYNLMLVMLSRTGHLHQVEELVQEMRAGGVPLDAASFTSTMTAYGSAGDTVGVMRVLSEMEAAGLKLTEIEFGAALGACGRNGDTARAKELFAMMREREVPSHVGHYTSLITSCRHSEDAAREAWSDMRARGIVPDVVAYTAFASCMSAPHALGKVRELLGEMRAAGIQPHAFFYCELLRAASNDEDDEAFIQTLQEMDQGGVPRNRRVGILIEMHRRRMENLQGERHAQHRAHEGVDGPAARPLAQPPMPLPAGWAQAVDPGTGKTYYWREADPSGSVTWERPV